MPNGVLHAEGVLCGFIPCRPLDGAASDLAPPALDHQRDALNARYMFEMRCILCTQRKMADPNSGALKGEQTCRILNSMLCSKIYLEKATKNIKWL
jgi:hypothetical protein